MSTHGIGTGQLTKRRRAKCARVEEAADCDNTDQASDELSGRITILRAGRTAQRVRVCRARVQSDEKGDDDVLNGEEEILAVCRKGKQASGGIGEVDTV